jgi:RecA-family ATPase
VAEKVRDLFNSPKVEHPCYVSGGVIPRSGIVLMGGQAKIGKTFLLIDLAHSLATGGLLWGMDYAVVERVPVLYCEQEIGREAFQERVQARYNKLGEQPPDNFFFISKMENLQVDTLVGQMKLSKEIEETGAKVVIIDPIGRCLSGEENDNNVIGKFFQRLDATIRKFPGLTFIIAHHFGKPRRDDDYDALDPYNFRGASKFFDAPDSLITFCPLNNRPGEWKRVKGRLRLRRGKEPEEDFELSVKEGGIVGKAPRKSEVLDGAGPVKGKKGWGRD